MLEFDEAQRVLNKILPGQDHSVPKDPEHFEEFRRESDELFLIHILHTAGITDITPYVSQLDEWNRTYLAQFAEGAHLFARTPKEQEKLRFLIEHSSQETLLEVLANRDNPFGNYNQRVLEELDRKGVNTDEWTRQNGLIRDAELRQEGTNLQFAHWRRDFRKEYPIGNISDCCIATANNTDFEYKRVLLDYFLDVGIQVLNMKLFSEQGATKIGQVYLTPLVATRDTYTNRGGESRRLVDEGEVYLAMSSVEIGEPHQDERLVAPIVTTVASEEGYAGAYNIPTTLVGGRFPKLTEHLAMQQAALHTLQQQVKSQRSKLTAKRRQLRGVQDTSDIEDQIDHAKEDIQTIKELYTQRIPCGNRRTKIPSRRPGIRSKGETYQGTDYLDIVRSGDDGFFSNPTHLTAQGYALTSPNILTVAETLQSALQKKYLSNQASSQAP